MSRVFAIAFATVALAVTALLFALPTPSNKSSITAVNTDGPSGGQSLLISNTYLPDVIGERTTTSILIRDGLIVAIDPSLKSTGDTTEIDGSGLTAIPGLIDSHTHSYGSALEDALRFGVTTNIDMFSQASMLPDTKTSRGSMAPTVRADMFSAGTLATAPGGHGTQFGFYIDTLSQASDAAKWVKARKLEGSDFIKLVYMPHQTRLPSLDRATAKAVIDAAHAEGLMAVAHISTQRAAQEIVTDGIDGLVHIFADEPVSDGFIELLLANNTFVIPTLAIIASVDRQTNTIAARDDVQQWLSPAQQQNLGAQFASIESGFDFDVALNNVTRLHDAGVTLLAGSDAPNPGTAHGVSLHRELQLLKQAGLSPSDAVHSATDLPATVFGLNDRGVIAIGKRADLLLVKGNPHQNISASYQIQHIIKNGHVVERIATPPEQNAKLLDAMLGSFEKDLNGPNEMAWNATTDSLAGGQSTATVNRVARDDGRFALSVSASVKSGFAYPWAGAGLRSSTASGALDVSQFSDIVFDVKGTPGVYRFMLFSGRTAGAPPTQEFKVTQNWQTVRLSVNKFSGFEPKNFTMLGIVAGPDPQNVDYLIDEVRFEP